MDISAFTITGGFLFFSTNNGNDIHSYLSTSGSLVVYSDERKKKNIHNECLFKVFKITAGGSIYVNHISYYSNLTSLFVQLPPAITPYLKYTVTFNSSL